MPWGTVEDLFRERRQQQGPGPAVPRVGSELTFVSPGGSMPVASLLMLQSFLAAVAARERPAGERLASVRSL